MPIHRLPVLMVSAVFTMASVVLAAQEPGNSIRANNDQVRQWNAFADNLYRLHQQQIAGRKIRETEQVGGYARLEGFYREVSYHDAASGRLLSRIQWERDNTDRIHGIEVYVHDDQGRVVRDYMAWYLPHYRNAPRATAINLYHFDGDLHGWRQFDASNTRTYERCTRQPNGAVVLEYPDEDRLAEAAQDRRSAMHGPEYRRCFAGLGKTAGRYLTPQ